MGTWTKWNCCIGTNGGPDAHGGGSVNGTKGGPDAHGGGWSMDIDVRGTKGGPDAHGGGSIDIDVRHRDPGRGLGFLTSNPAYP